jgi:hypothetical protein
MKTQQTTHFVVFQALTAAQTKGLTTIRANSTPNILLHFGGMHQ